MGMEVAVVVLAAVVAKLVFHSSGTVIHAVHKALGTEKHKSAAYGRAVDGFKRPFKVERRHGASRGVNGAGHKETHRRGPHARMFYHFSYIHAQSY